MLPASWLFPPQAALSGLSPAPHNYDNAALVASCPPRPGGLTRALEQSPEPSAVNKQHESPRAALATAMRSLDPAAQSSGRCSLPASVGAAVGAPLHGALSMTTSHRDPMLPLSTLGAALALCCSSDSPVASLSLLAQDVLAAEPQRWATPDAAGAAVCCAALRCVLTAHADEDKDAEPALGEEDDSEDYDDDEDDESNASALDGGDLTQLFGGDAASPCVQRGAAEAHQGTDEALVTTWAARGLAHCAAGADPSLAEALHDAHAMLASRAPHPASVSALEAVREAANDLALDVRVHMCLTDVQHAPIQPPCNGLGYHLLLRHLRAAAAASEESQLLAALWAQLLQRVSAGEPCRGLLSRELCRAVALALHALPADTAASHVEALEAHLLAETAHIAGTLLAPLLALLAACATHGHSPVRWATHPEHAQRCAWRLCGASSDGELGGQALAVVLDSLSTLLHALPAPASDCLACLDGASPMPLLPLWLLRTTPGLSDTQLAGIAKSHAACAPTCGATCLAAAAWAASACRLCEVVPPDALPSLLGATTVALSVCVASCGTDGSAAAAWAASVAGGAISDAMRARIPQAVLRALAAEPGSGSRYDTQAMLEDMGAAAEGADEAPPSAVAALRRATQLLAERCVVAAPQMSAPTRLRCAEVLLSGATHPAWPRQTQAAAHQAAFTNAERSAAQASVLRDACGEAATAVELSVGDAHVHEACRIATRIVLGLPVQHIADARLIALGAARTVVAATEAGSRHSAQRLELLRLCVHLDAGANASNVFPAAAVGDGAASALLAVCMTPGDVGDTAIELLTSLLSRRHGDALLTHVLQLLPSRMLARNPSRAEGHAVTGPLFAACVAGALCADAPAALAAFCASVVQSCDTYQDASHPLRLVAALLAKATREQQALRAQPLPVAWRDLTAAPCVDDDDTVTAPVEEAPPSTLLPPTGAVQCTFATGGNSFVQQHWYICYTCGLSGSRGCCSACARTCHAGHDVVYSRCSRFFCDCGGGGSSAQGGSCKCLAPVVPPALTPPAVSGGALRWVVNRREAPTEANDADASDSEDDSTALDGTTLPDLSPAFADRLLAEMSAHRVPHLLHAVAAQRAKHLLGAYSVADQASDAPVADNAAALSRAIARGAPLRIMDSPRVVSSLGGDVAQQAQALLLLRRAFRPGSFDTAPRPELAPHRDVATMLATGALRTRALACSADGLLAVSEGDMVCVLDAAALAGIGGRGVVRGLAAQQPPGGGAEGLPGSGTGVRPLSRSAARFHVLSLCFAPRRSAPARLLVVGAHTLQVWSLTSEGTVSDRLALGTCDVDVYAAGHAGTAPLAGSAFQEAGEPIIMADWCTPSAACCLAVTTRRVLLFNCSRDAAHPLCSGSPLDTGREGDHLVAAALAPPPAQHPAGANLLARVLVLTCAGQLYAGDVTEGGISFSSPITLPEGMAGRAGMSLSYSPATRLLLACCDGGATWAARLSDTHCGVVEACSCTLEVVEPPVDAENDIDPEAAGGPRGFAHWCDALPTPASMAQPSDALLLAVCNRTGRAVATTLRDDLPAQALAPVSGSSAAPTGWAGYRPRPPGVALAASAGTASAASPTCAFVFVLFGDGSLHTYARSLPALTPRGVQSALHEAAPVSAADDSDAVVGPQSPTPSRLLFTHATGYERLRRISRNVQLEGNMLAGGNARDVSNAALAQLTSETGSGLSAAHTGDAVLRICLPPDDSAPARHVLAAVRVHLPAASSGRPQRVVLPSGRAVPFSHAVQRWYDIPLTVEEVTAAAQTGQLELTFASDSEGGASSRIRVLGLDVFALSHANWTAEQERMRAQTAAAELVAKKAAARRELRVRSAHHATLVRRSRQACRLAASARHDDGMLAAALHALAALFAGGQADLRAEVESTALSLLASPSSCNDHAATHVARAACAALLAACEMEAADRRSDALIVASNAAVASASAAIQVDAATAVTPPPLPPSCVEKALWACEALAVASKAELTAERSSALCAALKTACDALPRLLDASDSLCSGLEFVQPLAHAACALLRTPSAAASWAASWASVTALLSKPQHLSSALSAALCDALTHDAQAATAACGLCTSRLIDAAQWPTQEQALLAPHLATVLAAALSSAARKPDASLVTALEHAIAALQHEWTDDMCGIAAALCCACAGCASASDAAANVLALSAARCTFVASPHGDTSPGPPYGAAFGKAPYSPPPAASLTAAAVQLAASVHPATGGEWRGGGARDTLCDIALCGWAGIPAAVAAQARSLLGPGAANHVHCRSVVHAARAWMASVNHGDCGQMELLHRLDEALKTTRVPLHQAACRFLSDLRASLCAAALDACASGCTSGGACAAVALSLLAMCFDETALPGSDPDACAWLASPLSQRLLDACVASPPQPHGAACASSCAHALQCAIAASTPAAPGRRAALAAVVAAACSDAPHAGRCAALLTVLVDKCGDGDFQDALSTALPSLVASLANHARSAATHPLAPLYEDCLRATGVLDTAGYVLEGDTDFTGHVGQVMSPPPWPPAAPHSLTTVAEAPKYSERGLVARLTTARLLTGFSVRISDPRPSRCAGAILLEVTDARTDLAGAQWRRLGEVHLAPGATSGRCEVPVPATATAVRLTFTTLLVNLHACSNEGISCPRCSRVVTHPRGICSSCRENALQCRACRNINYEFPHGWLCNECGACKHARFEWSLLCVGDTAGGEQAPASLARAIAPVRTAGEAAALVTTLAGEQAALERKRAALRAATPAVVHPAGAPTLVATYTSAAVRARGELTHAAALVHGEEEALRAFTVRDTAGVGGILAMPNHQQVSTRQPPHYGVLLTALETQLRLVTAAAKRRREWRTRLVALGLTDLVMGQSEPAVPIWRFLAAGPAACMAAAQDTVLACVSGLPEAVAGIGACIARQLAVASHLVAPPHVAHPPLSQEAALLEALASQSVRLADAATDAEEIAAQEGVWEACMRIAFLTLLALLRAPQARVSPALGDQVLLPLLRCLSAAQGKPAGGGANVDFKAWTARDKTFASFINAHHGGSRAGGARPLFQPSAWLPRLVLLPGCEPVRVQATALLRALLLAQQPPSDAVLQVHALVPAAVAAGPAGASFWALFTEVHAHAACSLASFPDGGGALAKAAEQLVCCVAARQWDGLDALTQALCGPDCRAALTAQRLLPNLLTAGLECAQAGAHAPAGKLAGALCGCVEVVPDAAAAVVPAACDALAQPAGRTPTGSAYLLSLLVTVTCPLPRVPDVALQLVKQASQEEFIRGSCGRYFVCWSAHLYTLTTDSRRARSFHRAPVLSTALGAPGDAPPVMRDVKNHICRHLGLDGLLDDDFGLELLVAGKLVALDAPVGAVFTHVWQPHAATQQQQGRGGASAKGPMAVIYRLQGLDGDATEPTVSVADLQAAASGGGGDGAQVEEQFGRLSLVSDGRWATVLGAADTWRLGLRGAATVSATAGSGTQGTDTALRVSPSAAAHEAATCALRLLDCASLLPHGRGALKAAGALPVLEEAVARAFTATSSSDATPVAEALLVIIERLLSDEHDASVDSQAAATTTTAQEMLDDASACARASAFWTHLLGACERGAHGTGIKAMARVIARLADSSPGAAQHLVACMLPVTESIRQAAAPDAHAAGGAIVGKRPDVLASVALLTCAHTRTHDLLRTALVAAGACDTLVAALRDLCAAYNEDSTSGVPRREPAEGSAAVALLPAALILLSGLARDCAPVGVAFQSHEALLAALHSLEGATGGLGTAAEGALDALAGCGCVPVAQHIAHLRGSTKEAQRAKALAWREQMLREMGMTRAGSGSGSGSAAAPGALGTSWGGSDRIVVAPSSFNSLTGGDDDDDDGDEGDSGAGPCTVCQEGYRLQPSEVLGVYVFVKRVPLAPAHEALAAASTAAPASTGSGASDGTRGLSALLGLSGELGGAGSSSSSGSGMCSSSHFNAIHVACHASARRADAALKTPKREWDGAATRNHGTRCNALLPLRSDAVSQAAYDAASDAYWAAVASATGMSRVARPPGMGAEEVCAARVHAAAHDLHLLLRRLAWGASLTVDAKGGSPTSNCCLALALAQTGVEALLAGGPGIQARFKAQLSGWADAGRDVRPEAPGEASLGYALTLSLLTSSLPKWRSARQAWFADAIRAAVADGGASDAAARGSLQLGGARPASRGWSGDAASLWALARPFVTWVALFDLMQHIAKRPSEAAGGVEAVAVRLRDLASCLDAAREMGDTLAELRGAQDLYEALDMVDALQDVVPDADREDATDAWMLSVAKT